MPDLDHRTADVRRRDRRRPRHRAGVVHQPVDPRDVSGRARERGRVVLLPGARQRSAASSASVRSGGCSTSCTSTTWRCCRNSGGQGVATALLDARDRPKVRGLASRARRSRCGSRTMPARQLYETLRVRGRRHAAATTTPTRSRMRSCSGAKTACNDLETPGALCYVRRTSERPHAAAQTEPTLRTHHKGGGA